MRNFSVLEKKMRAVHPAKSNGGNKGSTKNSEKSRFTN
jgi:hypothetical protein